MWCVPLPVCVARVDVYDPATGACWVYGVPMCWYPMPVPTNRVLPPAPFPRPRRSKAEAKAKADSDLSLLAEVATVPG